MHPITVNLLLFVVQQAQLQSLADINNCSRKPLNTETAEILRRLFVFVTPGPRLPHNSSLCWVVYMFGHAGCLAKLEVAITEKMGT